MQFLFLVGRLIKIISSETAWENIVKYYRKHLWKTLYKISSFPYDWTTSMAIMGIFNVMQLILVNIK
jgi:hypothetical protein